MCRIAGIIDKNKSIDQLQLEVKAMCDIMAHGGPDDKGYFEDKNQGLVFGHRRLSLIDLSPTGHQPMSYHKNKLTITYNGEIYNFLDLKKELLENGFQFVSQSDTEVILAAYQNWGIKAFEKLVGMFAFAIYDSEKQITFLVRDQMGIKPLYYAIENNRLVFASEVKAFEQSGNYSENKDWKTYFLAFGHIPEPYTTLSGVKVLPAGSVLSWDHISNKFDVLPFHFEQVAQNQVATSGLANQLHSAVKRHLLADAAVGVFLSGGIDSSIITLLADEVVGKNLQSLSINFNEAAFSEERFQQVVTAKTSGTHHQYVVKKEDFDQHFAEILTAMDQPSNDGINSWFVNKYAKETGLKAVLSGIGADELFGGYPSFNRMGLIRKLKLLPRFLLKLCAFIPDEKIKRICYLAYRNPIGEYLFLRGFFIPKDIARILGVRRAEVDTLIEALPVPSTLKTLKGKERASWFETNIFMRNQLLKDTDFMSMYHGVEVRVPFLDQDFVSFSDHIPASQRFQERPKGILIEAFKKLLPKMIWDRPKMGFTFPLQEWFLAGNQITDEKSYTGSPYSLKLLKKFKAGKIHWSKAFALYQISTRKF
ncbi:asparagine synthase (glutamine-hydrolyzing) [Pedobacter miscanthi]|uniref:asparagine synthase (glutamine-hydrolyzing) n=1 Tax=Pedobacter miscanthi TaxID=2259170 RepID=A0A366L956_9SPHI|nr:asparagine synthase (glutamine-hydrolyzing) [Pedobacter miscanthi]RBQ10013.1 asparagine synthase (glutamine-hydrolyzing) [Pedobacter miscanthi]